MKIITTILPFFFQYFINYDTLWTEITSCLRGNRRDPVLFIVAVGGIQRCKNTAFNETLHFMLNDGAKGQKTGMACCDLFWFEREDRNQPRFTKMETATKLVLIAEQAFPTIS